MLCQWALKWMTTLKPAERYLLKFMLPGAATLELRRIYGKQMRADPLWPLYLAVESMAGGHFPQDEWLADEGQKLERDLLTQMIIEALRGQATELRRYKALPRHPCPKTYDTEQRETRRMANGVFVMAFFAIIMIAIIMSQLH